MKLKIATLAVLFIGLNAFAQEQVINLEDNQSMSITGKGPGQDGAINPYYGQDSIAIVSNLGENPFSVRIQMNGQILRAVNIAPAAKKEILLLAGQELYFDSELKATTAISFKKARGK